LQFGNPARHSKSAQNQFKQRPHQTLSRKGSMWCILAAFRRVNASCRVCCSRVRDYCGHART